MPAQKLKPIALGCPYCGRPSVFVDSKEIYNGRSYGMIYLCRPCKAWVGCHKGTATPLGRLANAELREWKKRAHAAFDPCWDAMLASGESKSRSHVRGIAYNALAESLGVPVVECHIGMFDVDRCKQVVEVCAVWAVSGIPRRSRGNP